MNIEKLKKIVEKEDIKEFCKFFLEQEREEIIKLSGKEHNEVVELCGKLKGNKKLIQVYEFFPFLYNEGIVCLDDAVEGRILLENALISKFYFDILLSLIFKKDLNYAATLANKGTSLKILAEWGIETESNLKESLKCFDEAAPIFKRERSDLNYALTLMSKGGSLIILAEEGIETESNLKESLKCFDEAAPIFKRERSDLNYARTLTNKGTRLIILAEEGIETESNLKESLKFFNETAPIFKRERSDFNYALTLMNTGISLRGLAEEGIETESNLKESLKFFNEAAPIFKKEISYFYYALTLMHKGISLRVLARKGIETESNLKESLKCFDETLPIYKKERGDLKYAEILVNRGNSFISLAIHGIEIERNFERAISNYEEAEDTFFEKSFFLPFVITSFNHCNALWWRYTETKTDIYLENAIEIAKKGRKESTHITHPAKERLIDLLIQVYDTLKDKHKAYKKECYEKMHKKVDEVLARISILSTITERIDRKTDMISESVQKIETSCDRIIYDLEKSGVKLKGEGKEELRTLADDLRRANNVQLTNFTNELIKRFEDCKCQKEIEKASIEHKPKIKEIFSKITYELGMALPAAITAETLLPHIEAIMHQITILSEISPALASTFILIIIAIKKTLK